MRKGIFSQHSNLKQEALVLQEVSARHYREARLSSTQERYRRYFNNACEAAAVARACLFQLLENQK